MSIKYYYLCQDEDISFEGWFDAKPTICPNNPSHTINPTSISDVGVSTNLYTFSNLYKTNVSFPTRIIKFLFNPIAILPNILKKCRANIYMDNNLTNYTIIVKDVTHKTEMLSFTGNNTNELIITNIGELSNIPDEPALIEVYLSANGGNKNTYVYCDIMLFCT